MNQNEIILHLKRTLIICFVFNSIISGIAQTSGIKISGSVLANQNEGVAYATVALLLPDSTLKMGVITNAKGDYSFNDIDHGNYLIKVLHLEYKEYIAALNVDTLDQIVLPAIVMERNAVAMDEILITGKKPVISIHPDKLVFNVSSSIYTSGMDGLELLNKAPGVTLDLDNTISLQGKSGVLIFINGRPSRLSGQDLTTMLQSMQSDNIESIEIISNPSARYEAQGNAGIINIVLKTNSNRGFTGSLTSNLSRGDLSRFSNALTLDYGSQKWKAYASITRFDNEFQDDLDDMKYQSGYFLDLTSDQTFSRKGFNISSDIEYLIHKNHSLRFSAGGIITNHHSNLQSTTNIIPFTYSLNNEVLHSSTISAFNSTNLNASLLYEWRVSPTFNITTDISKGQYINDQYIDQPNTYLLSNGTHLRDVNNYFEPYTSIHITAASVDFEKKAGRFNLNFGSKNSHITTNNDFNVYYFQDKLRLINQEQSNNFTYSENVSAVYFISGLEINSKTKLNLGIRAEHTNSSGLLASSQSTLANNVIRSYTDLFPNASFSTKLFKNSEVSLSHSRRIGRPSYQDLNPFESKLSELALWKGNPFLNPNYTSNYQLSFYGNQKVFLSTSYSTTNGFAATVMEIVDKKGTILIPRNMNKVKAISTSVSYPFSIIKRWDLTTYASHTWLQYEGNFETANIDLALHQYFVRIQNNIKLPAGIDMEVYGEWSSRNIWRGSIYMQGNWGLNVGLKKSFLNDRLQLKLLGTDVFNTTSDYHFSGNYGGLNISGVRSFDTHRFGLRLAYKFGTNTSKSHAQKKLQLQDELNRITN